MTYMIDAWLERSDPYIRVIHKERKIPVLEWKGQQVNEMIASGALCPFDFSTSNINTQELVKELFILSCLEESTSTVM
ncbi:hypothetical protein [Neptunomonas concharum]|uniref:Uncharacterized protein n=1 Tax=Neptunomonas concharum TaxID=1031538 RepID=A0A5P1RCT0_9GAMM|nr:hypothetical protein [Neptunomonas concharum]QEQ97428.1 hypothetical protein F0U83_12275 [Neptunomonas concharum]